MSIVKSITTEFIQIPLIISWAFLAYWVHTNVHMYIRIICVFILGIGLKYMQKQNEACYHAAVLQQATRRKLATRTVSDTDLLRNRKI